MTRVPDWPARLTKFLEEAQKRAFFYGRWDCALMTAAWVKEATGVDHAAVFRAAYKSERTAMSLLARHRGLAVIITEILGDPMMATLAQRGDVVLACTDIGQTVGVCVGENAVFPGDRRGIRLLPVSECVQAWRI